MLNPTESITDNMDDLIVKALSDQQVVSEDKPFLKKRTALVKLGYGKVRLTGSVAVFK